MREIAVSIIIPVYNADLYLEQCLESILSQTLKNIEIICVDDGSTDKSLSIIEKYELTDKRISIIKQKHYNSGKARNIGLKHANGEYVLFIDADDFLEMKAIEIMYSKAKSKNVDIVVFGAYRYNNINNKKIYYKDALNISKNKLRENPMKKEAISDCLFDSLGIVVWNKLIKRNLIEKNKIKFQEITRSNDIYFSLVSLSLATDIFIIEEPLINYRIGHEDHLQAHNENDPLAFMSALFETQKKIKKVLKENYTKYENGFLNTALKIFKYNLKTLSKYPEEFYYVANAISYLGEKNFGFLLHDETWYKNRKDFIYYKKMVENFKMYSQEFKHYQIAKDSFIYKTLINIKKLFGLFKGFIISFRDNGMNYTLKRSFIHLKQKTK